MLKYSTKLISGKLMLVSRDIQVGDTVWNPVMNREEIVIMDASQLKGCSTSTDLMEVEQCNSYKVIGKISPDAVWVTEGMEFEEDDLFLNGLGQNWDDTTPLMGNHIVKIKCSQCKHFH